jgi:heterotetrameric sarcosine oxidase delta subunit
MRIKCPYCGERDAQEFAYLGAADPKRPDPDAEGAADAFYDYVYLRENPAGVIAELWYHTAGCHSWLRVERDTRTHIIHGVVYASPHEAGD